MIVPKLETEICAYIQQLPLEQQRHVLECVSAPGDGTSAWGARTGIAPLCGYDRRKRAGDHGPSD